MQNAIKQKIKKLCARAIDRDRAKFRKRQEYAAKFTKRTGHPTKVIYKPKTYPNSHFDPLFCKRNANFLAKTIWHKVQIGTYRPNPALKFYLDKPGGGKREIMQFTFPDAALAAVLNQRLTKRNLKKQSGNSFAYRPDRNVFDALLKLKSAIRPQRNYVLQIDFEKYFDTIPHDYLRKLLGQRDLMLVSKPEREAIAAFLTHRYAERADYASGIFTKREMGTPQGSSISLSLANLASQPLDQELEAINGQFARYADDSVVVLYSYEDAIRAYDVFTSHCGTSGLKINKDKSPGIRILSKSKEEWEWIPDFRFLGYGVCTSGLIMHSSVENRLRVAFSRLINLYLVHYIEKKPLVSVGTRVGVGYDWDLLGLLSEIRNVLYGGLSEEEIRSFMKQDRKLPRMRGYMGFYALLDSSDALARLDGWLASNVRQALYKRYKILGLSKTISSKELISGAWYDAATHSSPGFKPDATLPSLVRGWAAARKYYFAYGLEDIDPPKYLSYY